jgi:radical SAM family uncharacterized protein/radical SAM-linked protein
MKSLREQVEKHLLKVQKPGQYTGGELNSVVKENPRVRMAISYPDMYEVGMSNNGIRILYDIVNSMDNAACERVFAPAHDFEALLRKENIPLYTLETFTPLHELDLMAFNLSHELLYTNMLQILDLGRVPLLREERGDGHPLVMAGGSAVSNPLPAFDFLDAVYLGDGEEGIREIIEVLLRTAGENVSREERIGLLGEIQGVLLPGDYAPEYENGKLLNRGGKSVRKRSCGKGHNPLKPIVPSIRITQERAVYEITRGCSNMCKFCHAGYYDLPYREFPVESAADDIISIIQNTGYDELSLLSLSVSDVKKLPELLNSILPELSSRGVSVSLPSMKVDLSTLPLIEVVSDIRKSSLTFAVESASDEVRSRAYKRVNTHHLLSIIEHVFNNGWSHIKLYFMLGLPGCGEHDEGAAIVSLLKRIISIPGKKKNINVTLSPFVPKPHTPFEREKQMDEEYFHEKVIFIKKNLPRYVKIKSHNIQASLLEGVISRGESRVGAAILKAYSSGCRFDSWSEHFDYEKWEAALNEEVPGWRDFLEERESSSLLPWSMIETGFEKVKDAMGGKSLDLDNYERRSPDIREKIESKEIEKGAELFREKYRVEFKARLVLSKRGASRFIPHIDFMEVLKRGLRMSGAPVSFTQGFNKRERISLGFPLPLGIESDHELLDVELFEEFAPSFLESFNARLPEGISLHSYRYFDEKGSLMSISSAAEFQVRIHRRNLWESVRESCEKKTALVKRNKKGEKSVAFDDAVESFGFTGEDMLRIRLFTGTPDSVRIDLLLETLTGDENFRDYTDILKTGTFTRRNEEYMLLE